MNLDEAIEQFEPHDNESISILVRDKNKTRALSSRNLALGYCGCCNSGPELYPWNQEVLRVVNIETMEVIYEK